MSVDIEQFRQGKHPAYNPKKTIAVTQRVLSNWCLRSNYYLDNARRGLVEAERMKVELGSAWAAPLPTGQPVQQLKVVAYDNLEYGLEQTLKAAQMVDGYHEFNKGMAGIQGNLDIGGMPYVYVRPTHRLDLIYDECLSETMKAALSSFLPVRSWIHVLYDCIHSEGLEINWSPGKNYALKNFGAGIRYDSKRYSGDWTNAWLDSSLVLTAVTLWRELNAAIPLWFDDRTLKARNGSLGEADAASLRAGLASIVGPT